MTRDFHCWCIALKSVSTETFSYDDVIKWKHFPRYRPFVRRIHRSPENSPHKGQWRGALIYSLICTWMNDWIVRIVSNREDGDLRRHCANYNIIVMLVCHSKPDNNFTQLYALHLSQNSILHMMAILLLQKGCIFHGARYWHVLNNARRLHIGPYKYEVHDLGLSELIGGS